jgi:hypothetical protein
MVAWLRGPEMIAYSIPSSIDGWWRNMDRGVYMNGF